MNDPIKRNRRVDRAALILLRRLNLDESVYRMLADFVLLAASSEFSESIDEMISELKEVTK